ncbi:hypothetical protein [Glycomyces artemisiae]|uniref:Uncharacterized protein n=1 Tax=Glycomyces artemisiae TaxID=1076443 RepID=A0A2T0U6J9_9ACTN|nr:hypothetical protein [Glycomyces artemisiae]PRY53512.1 hypothetical protein B0I28_11711 [Glycomyces artemisiae]
MFDTATYYQASCGGAGCTAALLDANLSRYYSDDEPESFDSPEQATEAAAAAGWAVVDGKLLCVECTPADVVADDDPWVTVAMLTATVYWTVHCETCAAGYTDGESGTEVQLYEPVLDQWTLQALADLEWEVVETTPVQHETLFGPEAAPGRTWATTCDDCVAEAAFRDRLAALAA